MIRRVFVLVAILSAVAGVACTYDPKYDANGIKCMNSGSCPSGYQCAKVADAGTGVCCNKPDQSLCLAPAAGDAATDRSSGGDVQDTGYATTTDARVGDVTPATDAGIDAALPSASDGAGPADVAAGPDSIAPAAPDLPPDVPPTIFADAAPDLGPDVPVPPADTAPDLGPIVTDALVSPADVPPDALTGACVVNGSIATAGTTCRPAVGVCDNEEVCDGVGPDCPADVFLDATTVCRASTDNTTCDPPEKCTGTSASCPADILYSRPVMPTGLTATSGTLLVSLAWDAAVDATGYNVKRSIASGTGYTIQGAPPTTLGLSYTDTGLAGGTPYYYVVSAVNTIPTCESTDSAQESATPTGICTPPATPTGLSATPGSNEVSLSWVVSTGATSYSLARSTTSGTGYSSIASVATNSYVDKVVDAGTPYYYVVSASNGSCSSGNSGEVPGTPVCPTLYSPTGMSAVAHSGAVALNWNASTNATSYSIARSTTKGSGYASIGQATGTSYVDSSVATGVEYYYVVNAIAGACTSGQSTESACGSGIYCDDFEDGSAVGWTMTGGTWSVIADGSEVLKQGGAGGGDYATVNVPASATSVTVQAHVKVLQFGGTGAGGLGAGVVANYSGTNSKYFFEIAGNGALWLRRAGGQMMSGCPNIAFTATVGTVYTLRMTVTGGAITTYVNGVMEHNCTDPSPLAPGGAGVATIDSGGGTYAEFDDVLIF